MLRAHLPSSRPAALRWPAGLVGALLVALVLAAGARAAPPVGTPAPDPILAVGDQRARAFSDPRFRALGVKRTRIVIPWDAAVADARAVGQWLAAARRAQLEPVVAFGHAEGDRCPAQPCHAPTVAEYRAVVARFRERYGWVSIIEPWNAANSVTEPTARDPRRAAGYYNAVRALCPSCTVPAADVQDRVDVAGWLGRFRRYARGRPQLWGLHNFADVNSFSARRTRRVLRAVSGKVWITQTGGLYSYSDDQGEAVLRPSERRAAEALRWAITIAMRHRDRIERVYLYNWSNGSALARFDSGLVGPDGEGRMALRVLGRYRALFR